MLQKTVFLVFTLFVLYTTVAGCSQQAQAPVYDPGKQYAAYLVVKSPQATQALNTAKQKSSMEGFLTGPIVYYEPGTKDFDEHFKQLTPSKQISLIWVVGSLLDTPNIQKALSNSGYKGQLRYEPVTGTSTRTEP